MTNTLTDYLVLCKNYFSDQNNPLISISTELYNSDKQIRSDYNGCSRTEKYDCGPNCKHNCVCNRNGTCNCSGQVRSNYQSCSSKSADEQVRSNYQSCSSKSGDEQVRSNYTSCSSKSDDEQVRSNYTSCSSTTENYGCSSCNYSGMQMMGQQLLFNPQKQPISKNSVTWY